MPLNLHNILFTDPAGICKGREQQNPAVSSNEDEDDSAPMECSAAASDGNLPICQEMLSVINNVQLQLTPNHIHFYIKKNFQLCYWWSIYILIVIMDRFGG